MLRCNGCPSDPLELFDEFFTFYRTSEPQIRCHEEGDVEKFTGLEVTPCASRSVVQSTEANSKE